MNKNIVMNRIHQKNAVPLPRRLISYLIDWYVGGLCTAIPISIVSQKLTGTMTNQNLLTFDNGYAIGTGIFALLFALFYFVIVPTYIWKGQTVGKRICKLKVVQVDNQEVTLKNMLLRQVIGMIVMEGAMLSASTIWHQILSIITNYNFITLFMYIGFGITLISVVMLLFSTDSRALHDYLGSTKVVCV
ncbi:MAG: RDD family protein [Coprobacillaceae bacterium]